MHFYFHFHFDNFVQLFKVRVQIGKGAHGLAMDKKICSAKCTIDKNVWEILLRQLLTATELASPQ